MKLPRLGSSKLVSYWLLTTLAASIVAALDGGFLSRWAALAPTRILQGELWRLFTWPFVVPHPMTLILTCASIFKFGSELASRWGDRRLQRFATEIVIAAAVVTSLLSIIAGNRHLWHLAGWAIPDMLVIAWARQFPDRSLVLYGLVTLRGRQLVMVTVGATLVFAIFIGPVAVAPELAACGLAAAYPEWLLKRR